MLRQTSFHSHTSLLFTAVVFVLLFIVVKYDYFVDFSFSAPSVYHESCNAVPIPTESSSSQVITSAPISTPTAAAFPEKIWYKVGPQGVSTEAENFRNHCLDLSPSYEYEILDDEAASEYVYKWFSDRPDIITTYFSLNVPILRADLLRYLILWAEGGMWMDLDVSCGEVPIHRWVLKEYREAANLVVGLEFDWPWENDNFLHAQFTSWTIMAKPQSPHMMQVIDDILVGVDEVARQHNVSLDGIKMGMIPQVVDLTGPKRMTWSIVKSLNRILERELDDRDITGLRSAKLVHDVLILPGNAFAASQSNFPKDQGPVLVTHHYAGTWKNKLGGEEGKPAV
ncbi:putative initiation-specific alpha mannosyltransferase protein [Botrytis fragariae]|uniref:Putative initiation-specific alpha mannosyltransferase protein n=1 Tax=Botrytis fragariae TaxID=1964551 RepID=A0A8H6AP68_9HELO|nr:putative initiation-specific alpha mannosyltransferase protein [Botrytis fragariae]KAF5870949.1 putative initiation-specific alpha mannosyltransferase protein [Botrytis fragariae]